jgi:hypothetical protein
MNSYDTKLTKLLTYSGTLPLVICAIAIKSPLESIDWSFIASAYSALIISFLCGMHWSIHFFVTKKCPQNLLLTSNATTLLAWLTLLIYPSSIAFFLQIVCFLYLLNIDHKLHNANILPSWFYNLRCNASFIVVLSLIIITGFSLI